MGKTLLIFVDSFPWNHLADLRHLSRFHRKQMKSGLGFSINIKAEMFAGRTCDEIGYFNEWMYSPKSSFRRHRWWFGLLGPSSITHVTDRIAHRGLGRLLFRQNILNIPFRYLPYFEKAGTDPYEDDFPLPSIFSESPSLRKLIYKELAYSAKRDRVLFERARAMIEKDTYDSFFIASADLDGLTHRVGVGSPQYLAKLAELDELIGDCTTTFLTRHPEGTVIVLSDHSMANVTGDTSIDPEGEVGPPGEDTYLYFVDATMLRVWSFNAKTTQRWTNFLSSLSTGRVLSDDERAKYHVLNRAFGSLIYVLDEGLVFNPTFWGKGVPKAMHGYHPNSQSQVGFVASNQDILPRGAEITPLKVWEFLAATMGG